MNGRLIFFIAAAIYLAMKEINALEIGAATATVLTAETEGLLDHEDIYYRFLDMKNKLERDKIYTAVYIHEHPEYKYLIENNSNIDILELEKLLADS